MKDPQLNTPNDLLLNKSIPVTLNNNLLTFRETDQKFEIQGDLLKMIIYKNYDVELANLSNKKIL